MLKFACSIFRLLNKVMLIWPTIQYKGIYFSWVCVACWIIYPQLEACTPTSSQSWPYHVYFKTFFFVNLASIIFFGNTCSMNFATSQAIYGGSLFFPRIRRRAAYLCIKRGKPASYKDHLTPGRAVRGEKNMLSGSLLKFNFYDFRKRFATLSVVWDKLFCKFRISVYTFHHCFYGAYAGKTNKNMRNENYILVKI